LRAEAPEFSPMCGFTFFPQYRSSVPEGLVPLWGPASADLQELFCLAKDLLWQVGDLQRQVRELPPYHALEERLDFLESLENTHHRKIMLKYEDILSEMADTQLLIAGSVGANVPFKELSAEMHLLAASHSRTLENVEKLGVRLSSYDALNMDKFVGAMEPLLKVMSSRPRGPSIFEGLDQISVLGEEIRSVTNRVALFEGSYIDMGSAIDDKFDTLRSDFSATIEKLSMLMQEVETNVMVKYDGLNDSNKQSLQGAVRATLGSVNTMFKELDQTYDGKFDKIMNIVELLIADLASLKKMLGLNTGDQS